MTDHTPGPWDYCMNGDVAHIMAQHPSRPDCGYTLAIVEAFDKETTEQYARLIAAAPELLAVAQMIADSAPGPGYKQYIKPDKIEEAARAALAKVKP